MPEGLSNQSPEQQKKSLVIARQALLDLANAEEQKLRQSFQRSDMPSDYDFDLRKLPPGSVIRIFTRRSKTQDPHYFWLATGEKGDIFLPTLSDEGTVNIELLSPTFDEQELRMGSQIKQMLRLIKLDPASQYSTVKTALQNLTLKTARSEIETGKWSGQNPEEAIPEVDRIDIIGYENQKRHSDKTTREPTPTLQLAPDAEGTVKI